MDRRKLGKRSLHSNLSTAFNNASMTSLKRIGSVSSLSSQTSNSSSKRQIDEDSNDDSASTSSRASKKKKNSESEDNQNQQNNVRTTRGNFQSTGDETDDSLCPAPKKRISLPRSSGSETKKRNQGNFLLFLFLTFFSLLDNSCLFTFNLQNIVLVLFITICLLYLILFIYNCSIHFLEATKKKVATPQKPPPQAETPHRNFNATRRELTLEPDSSEDDDIFDDEAPSKKQKTTETVEQVAAETSQLSLRDSETFKKPQAKATPTSSSQSLSQSRPRPGPKSYSQSQSRPRPGPKSYSQSRSQSLSQSRPGPKSHAMREAALRKENWLKTQQKADRENAEVVTAAPDVLTNFFASCGVVLSVTDEPHFIRMFFSA